MQLAQILSDLVSLRPGVCDPAAALALVSARPSSSIATATATATANAEDGDGTAREAAVDAGGDVDVDLKRAEELVALHHAVREGCTSGALSSVLAEARRAVDRAVG
ncbi:uncharacterized protein M421DRAFT_2062 [Didymella exigua CBS 183.55]|uniref:Uncharacterized protein n=1 Tax=Didymella exigua CBS 183.55 TaxID=1150837 RepID=A0A6A5RY41_9PLEO|nr:uncharacterized protein M421DRAFT_2062 [Didymella exigua CBS 183.55]KAF1932439.1 hypothetical protein M421DRAFT_2062 [Didymella exigua CBS 183.55]